MRLFIENSDLIIGMSSMFLIEACLMGKPLLSVQIGLNKEDSFILSRLKATRTILTYEELKKHLHEAIFLKRKFKNKFNYIKSPTKNIIELMEKMLQNHL